MAAKGIRFTKAEREYILLALDGWDCGDKPARIAARESVRAKLEVSELPVKGSYLTVPGAIAAFRDVLGQRLIAPPFAAVGVLSQMKQRIAALGLTLTDCHTIAKTAGVSWRGPIRAESLVRQADRLLAESQGELSFEGTAPAGPVELSDDEI